MCPYHAWTYALDGRLIATPHLGDDDVDKDALSLWSVATHEWQGFVFVCLAKQPPAFDEWITVHGQELVGLERFGLADLRVAVRTVAEVSANWKIIVENYQECLHCTRVHPELVELIPVYRTGGCTTTTARTVACSCRDGGHSLATDGHSPLPVLPGLSDVDASSYYGCTMFPDAFVDVTGSCVIVSYLYPKGPTAPRWSWSTCSLRRPSPIRRSIPRRSSSSTRWSPRRTTWCASACTRACRPSLFAGGVLSPKDDLVIGFVQHYLAACGPVALDSTRVSSPARGGRRERASCRPAHLPRRRRACRRWARLPATRTHRREDARS